jgi:chromate transport protein ChrA
VAEKIGCHNALVQRLSLPQIGLVFLRRAGLVFGGAISIGPSLEAELVQRRGALERSDFWLSYGLSQMMPSIILANSALSLGNKLRGPPGAVAVLRVDGLWVVAAALGLGLATGLG